MRTAAQSREAVRRLRHVHSQRENQILVQRISAISARKNEFASDKPWSKANAGGGGPKLSSAEINRRRAANKIAQVTVLGTGQWRRCRASL